MASCQLQSPKGSIKKEIEELSVRFGGTKSMYILFVSIKALEAAVMKLTNMQDAGVIQPSKTTGLHHFRMQ